MKSGDAAWIIENGWTITQVEILRVSGNLYTIRPAGKEGAYRVPAHRLYPTQDAAQHVVDNRLRPGNRGPGLH